MQVVVVAMDKYIENTKSCQAQWLTPVILATQEIKSRSSMVQG
jgi:hypothetical protein